MKIKEKLSSFFSKLFKGQPPKPSIEEILEKKINAELRAFKAKQEGTEDIIDKDRGPSIQEIVESVKAIEEEGVANVPPGRIIGPGELVESDLDTPLAELDALEKRLKELEGLDKTGLLNTKAEQAIADEIMQIVNKIGSIPHIQQLYDYRDYKKRQAEFEARNTHH